MPIAPTQLQTAGLCLLALQVCSGCLDWDSLRGQQDAGADGADTAPMLTEAPVAQWRFYELAGTTVVDQAKAAPDVPLALNPSTVSTVGLVQEAALRLQDAILESSVTAGRQLGDAIAKAGGGFSFHIWINLPAGTEMGTIVSLPALSVSASDTALFVVASTTTGDLDLTYPWSADGDWHHVGITFRPGLTALLTIYLDGKAVLASSNDKPTVAASLLWSTDESDAVIRIGSEDLRELRVSSSAVFTVALSEQQMQQVFALGRSR